jgi:hypothetical protein
MTLESNKYGIVGRSRAIADVIDRIDLVSPTERDDMQERQAELVREHVNVEKRLKRLMDAIETGGEVASVLARIRELETRRQQIGVELRSLQPILRLEPNLIEDRLTEWRRLLRQFRRISLVRAGARSCRRQDDEATSRP